MQLTKEDFIPLFGDITPYVEERINKYAFEHREITGNELYKLYGEISKILFYDKLPISGSHRHQLWEDGWAENLKAFNPNKAGLELAKPHYINKYAIVRWKGKFYTPVSEDYEYNMLAIIQDWLFDKYLRDVSHVYEFGCGTGHNLFRVRDVNPTAKLVGLDWADSAVKFVELQARHGAYGDPKLASSHHFDYFNPDPWVTCSNTTAYATVASLEQVGPNWHPFLDYVLKARPKICVHIEPIEEVLDKNVLLDQFSLRYFSKRNYLSGYLTQLRRIEEEGRIKIHEVTRTHIGSKFIEGYTVVVWSVV